MCAGGSGVNANCPSGRTTLSPTYRDISKISRFSYHLCEHWVFVAEVDAGKTIENGVVMRRQQRITHTANCCEIWAKVSEIEWQNIWGQSCCFPAQFNMWNVNFSLLSRSSSKGRFDIVSYSILIFSVSAHPLPLSPCGPQNSHMPSNSLQCFAISLEYSNLFSQFFFLLTNESCHVPRCLRIEIWFADYRRLSRARAVRRVVVVICCFWRDCHYSRCGTMMSSWLWWGCCGTPIHDCVVIVYWVLVATVRYARTW